MPRSNASLAVVALITLVIGLPAAGRPQAVSPGHRHQAAAVELRCPTFSWSEVPDADGYELVVSLIEPDPSGERPRAESFLTIHLEGAVSSWTPSGDECLAPGQLYAWTVRARGATVTERWSEPRFFKVTAGPSVAEIEAALATLRMFFGQQPRSVDEASSPPAAASTVGAANLRSEKPPARESAQAAITSLIAALLAEESDSSGTTAGVFGVSNSPDGFGLAAANKAGGADLLLDGGSDGETNTTLSQAGVDRASSEAETFDITNSGAGSMTLQVEGVTVVTSATDNDTLAGLPCDPGEVAKWGGASWVCSPDADTTCNGAACDGSLFANVDAEFLDGLSSEAFALDDHSHPEMEAAICRLFEASTLQCERAPAFCSWSTVPRCFCEEAEDTRLVFRTSLTFNGDLVSACGGLGLSCGSGALDAADAICQHLADDAGLSGTYKAWLSDGVTAPGTTFSKTPDPYCRTDGLLVAESYSDLTDCTNPDCLNSPINVTEAGGPSDLGTWSNTATDGTPLTVDTHCTAWTSTEGNGRIGNPNSVGSFWTAHTGLSSCGSSRGLYCFQQ